MLDAPMEMEDESFIMGQPEELSPPKAEKARQLLRG
jgi:hypothetical protein